MMMIDLRDACGALTQKTTGDVLGIEKFTVTDMFFLTDMFYFLSDHEMKSVRVSFSWLMWVLVSD